MGKLGDVIGTVETALQAAGYSRANENFTLERVGSNTVHKSYTFGEARIQTVYDAMSVADYAGTVVPVLLAWKVKGTHNSTKTFGEGYTDFLNEYEAIENTLVMDQTQPNDEDIEFPNTTIRPFLSKDNQDFLIMEIEMQIDATRQR